MPHHSQWLIPFTQNTLWSESIACWVKFIDPFNRSIPTNIQHSSILSLCQLMVMKNRKIEWTMKLLCALMADIDRVRIFLNVLIGNREREREWTRNTLQLWNKVRVVQLNRVWFGLKNGKNKHTHISSASTCHGWQSCERWWENYRISLRFHRQHWTRTLLEALFVCRHLFCI